MYRTKTKALTLSIILSLWASTAINHETPLAEGWCDGPGDLMVLISQYDLDEQQIRSHHQNRVSGDSLCLVERLDRSCGQLDHDDYGLTRSASFQQCYFDHPLARPVFFGPSTFLDNRQRSDSTVAAHHAAYTMDQGIQFGCYICTSR